MKRFSAFLLAAVTVLSTAGCSSSSAADSSDKDISVVTQRPASGKDPVTVTDPEVNSDPYADPAGFEMTDAQEMVELLNYAYFGYNAHAQVYDSTTQVHTVYEGYIDNETTQKQIYDMLCSMIKNNEVPFSEEWDAMGGSRPILSLYKNYKTDHYSTYSISDGLMVTDSNDGGSNIYILQGPHSCHYLAPDYNQQQAFEQLIRKGIEKPENIKSESGGEKIAPAPTTTDELVKSRITSFEYSAKTIKENTAAERRSYYEGKIDEFTLKKDIFNTICKIITNKKIDNDDVAKKLPTGQRCVLEKSSLVTLTNSEGGEFRLFKATLFASANNSSGQPVWAIVSPNGKRDYFTYDEQEMKLLTELVQQGICSAKNFIRDEYSGSKTPDASKKLTAKDLAYISVRTSYSEGSHIAGYYVSKKGELFNFNFSEIEDSGRMQFTDWLIMQIEIQSQTADPERTVDVAALNKGLGFAAKIDPNAKVTEENKMFDYGQNTAYAIVDGKFVMLWSEGDNDKTVEDINVPKAVAAFNEALRPLESYDDR